MIIGVNWEDQRVFDVNLASREVEDSMTDFDEWLEENYSSSSIFSMFQKYGNLDRLTEEYHDYQQSYLRNFLIECSIYEINDSGIREVDFSDIWGKVR